MNALKKFLTKKSKAKVNKGDLGQESEWLEFSTLNLKGTKLLICDATFVPSVDDGLEVKLKPGNYNLLAKVLSYGSDRRVSRLRILPPDTEVKLGGVVGETWADTALIAVCDLELCTKANEALGEDKMEDICNDLLDKGDNCGVMVLDKKTEAVAPYVSSGFGDGTFKVFKLLSGRKAVGVEIEFIAGGTPYPFDLPDKPKAKKPSADEIAAEKRTSEAIKNAWKGVEFKKTGDLQRDRENFDLALKEVDRNLERELLVLANEFKKHVVSLRRNPLRFSIKYVPTDDAGWMDSVEANKQKTFLVGLGFSYLGCFTIQEFPNHRVALFARMSDCIVAGIAPAAAGKTTVDYFCYYPDGRSYIALNDPEVFGVTQPPWITKRYYPGISPERLLDVFIQDRPCAPFVTLQNEQALFQIEESFRRTQIWRAERGGWTPNEIKAQLGVGDEPEHKDKVESNQHDLSEKWLLAWLRLQTHLTFSLDEVIESIVIVHDNLTPEQLNVAWGYSTGEVTIRSKMFVGINGRTAFAKVNQERGNKLRLVAQKHTPIEADFYLPA